jgi:hypothetical protein
MLKYLKIHITPSRGEKSNRSKIKTQISIKKFWWYVQIQDKYVPSDLHFPHIHWWKKGH